MILRLTIFTLMFISVSTFGQDVETVVTENEFLGIRLGQTTLQKADSILTKISYKEPKKYSRSIRWRDGGCTIILQSHYFIRTKKSKIDLILTSDKTTIDEIQILSIRSGNDIHYLNVILGKTRVNSLVGLSEKEWDEDTDYNGETFCMAQFEKIDLGIEGSLNTEKNNKITRFILTK